VGNFCGGGQPCEPTAALPGTPEKVAILEERARMRQELWHPLDGTQERSALVVLKAG
jgi:hypothetical protein